VHFFGSYKIATFPNGARFKMYWALGTFCRGRIMGVFPDGRINYQPYEYGFDDLELCDACLEKLKKYGDDFSIRTVEKISQGAGGGVGCSGGI